MKSKLSGVCSLTMSRILIILNSLVLSNGGDGGVLFGLLLTAAATAAILPPESFNRHSRLWMTSLSVASSMFEYFTVLESGGYFSVVAVPSICLNNSWPWLVSESSS